MITPPFSFSFHSFVYMCILSFALSSSHFFQANTLSTAFITPFFLLWVWWFLSCPLTLQTSPVCINDSFSGYISNLRNNFSSLKQKVQFCFRIIAPLISATISSFKNPPLFPSPSVFLWHYVLDSFLLITQPAK